MCFFFFPLQDEIEIKIININAFTIFIFNCCTTVCIRIVADFESRIFQFTTNVDAGYNVQVYYYYGYYFYTLLAVWALFSVLLIALAKTYSFAILACVLAIAIANVYGLGGGYFIHSFL